MSAQDHRTHAGDTHVLACVVTVSSTRTAVTDTSGPAIATALAAASHTVRDVLIVDDDEIEIRSTVRTLAEQGVDLVVLTGGTGLAPSDVTPEALDPLFTRRIDGFGELFRWLSFEQVGPAAMLSRAVGGLVGQTAVFALPGSTRACLLAIERLILPEIRHLIHLARVVRPAHVDELDELDEPLSVELVPEAPGEVPQGAQGEGSRWMRAVGAWGGRIVRGAREELPESVASLAPVRNVLEGAGEVAVLQIGDRRYSLWGFPDLRRPQSKVLAVGRGGPTPEIVALHRYPTEVGTIVEGGLLARATGIIVPDEAEGVPLAVAAGSVYTVAEGQVTQWEGSSAKPVGTTSQALATLVLDWSQR